MPRAEAAPFDLLRTRLEAVERKGLERPSAPTMAGSAFGAGLDSLLGSGVESLTSSAPGTLERSPLATPQLVESRVVPALARDLQGQLGKLEEGEGRVIELRLDPPELGRVNVRISMQGEEVKVVFTAAGAGRDALELALPRLREMFEGAGLSLGEASVGGEAQRNPRDGLAKREGLGQEGQEEAGAPTPEPSVKNLAEGRVSLRV